MRCDIDSINNNPKLFIRIKKEQLDKNRKIAVLKSFLNVFYFVVLEQKNHVFEKTFVLKQAHHRANFHPELPSTWEYNISHQWSIHEEHFQQNIKLQTNCSDCKTILSNQATTIEIITVSTRIYPKGAVVHASKH